MKGYSALLACLQAAVLAAGALAQEPAKPPAPPSGDEAAVNQEILARQFRDFEQALLRLAQRLERSSRPEDRERAANLKKAIALASDQGVDAKFDKLVGVLRVSKSLSVQEIQEAMTENQMVSKDIKAILVLLMTDNRDDELKREQERIAKLIKRLEEVIRQQKVVRAQTEAGKIDSRQVGDAQQKVSKKTEELARDLTKKDKTDPGKGNSKDQGDSQDKGKDSQQRGKDNKGKGEGKPKEREGQNSKDGQQGESQSADGSPGKKQVQEANQHQKQAEQQLDKNDKKQASRQQDKAIDKLEEARRKLEEILRQLREEEQERILAALQQRVERMLQMQIEVYEGTTRVERAIADNPDKKPTRANEQRALQLCDREEEIIKEANKAIQLLQEEGSAVAFPEVFTQVRDDMRNAARRLGKADVGQVTQVIEQDIINTLKEMVEALKKAQQRLQARKGQPGAGGQPPDQRLIELLAELKMIRAMQIRVNTRTHVYGVRYTGEQAADPEIQQELQNLAQRQWKIFEVTNNIYRGNNR
jgi:hypothetical protein